MNLFQISGNTLMKDAKRTNEPLFSNQKISSKQQLVSDIIKQTQQSSEHMSEEDKAKLRARIMAKLKSGKKLTAEEEAFLQETDAMLYMQYKRIRAMADHMASQLKSARSKQEANEVINRSINGVSKDDPYKEYVLAALGEVAKEYKQSTSYHRLPEKESDVKKEKQTRSAGEETEKKADREEEYFDVSTWSPLQEIIDELPKFQSLA